jgi:L-asparaginase
MMKPRVAIFFTGGTIAMKMDAMRGGAVPALSGADLVRSAPGIEGVADIEAIDFASLPGPHMTPSKMLELSRAVSAKLADPGVAGAVVTHGTDTLEETAYLLDLVLAEDKPIAFVGAMRNSSELSWDGPANLRSAVQVAAEPTARGLGVVVAMTDRMIAASEAVKVYSEAPHTFDSRDFGPLGLIDKDRVIVSRRPAEREHVPTDRLEERVDIVQAAAGADGRFVECAIDSGAKGLVLQALGRGNLPPAMVPAIERAVGNGLPVVITSRCPKGRVLDTYAYEGGGKQLTQLGAILGGMLPSHKARLKLMVLLGTGWSPERIRRSFES